MEIPLNAPVECTDGVYGRSVFVLINPVVEEVTHLVVRADESPNTETIVPVERVTETIAGTVQLSCSKADLKTMDPFIKTRFIQEKVAINNYAYGGLYGAAYFYLPFNVITVSVPKYDQQIPPGELAVNRGTRVEATDGYIGKVDEFVVNPQNGHITHLVMREGHLWGQKDVIIPLSAMGETHDDTVYLKLNKLQVGSLPTFPVRRRWA